MAKHPRFQFFLPRNTPHLLYSSQDLPGQDVLPYKLDWCLLFGQRPAISRGRITAFRNARTWAKNQRDTAIAEANSQWEDYSPTSSILCSSKASTATVSSNALPSQEKPGIHPRTLLSQPDVPWVERHILNQRHRQFILAKNHTTYIQETLVTGTWGKFSKPADWDTLQSILAQESVICSVNITKKFLSIHSTGGNEDKNDPFAILYLERRDVAWIGPPVQ